MGTVYIKLQGISNRGPYLMSSLVLEGHLDYCSSVPWCLLWHLGLCIWLQQPVELGRHKRSSFLAWAEVSSCWCCVSCYKESAHGMVVNCQARVAWASHPTGQHGDWTTPPFRSSTLRIATGGTLGAGGLAIIRPDFITKSAVLKYFQTTVVLEVGSLSGSW